MDLQRQPQQSVTAVHSPVQSHLAPRQPESDGLPAKRDIQLRRVSSRMHSGNRGVTDTTATLCSGAGPSILHETMKSPGSSSSTVSRRSLDPSTRGSSGTSTTRSTTAPSRAFRTSCNSTRNPRISGAQIVSGRRWRFVRSQTDYADTAALANGGFDRATNSYPAKLGEVLDIVIQNIAGQTSGVAEAHPWHSHGEKYWDMGHGPGNFSYEALAASNANRTGKPYLRDTSVAYPSPGASYSGQTTTKGGPAGWRLFRIRVEDPGLWLIHCHIAPHQVMGMMTMFLYGVSAEEASRGEV